MCIPMSMRPPVGTEHQTTVLVYRTEIAMNVEERKVCSVYLCYNENIKLWHVVSSHRLQRLVSIVIRAQGVSG